MLCTLVDQSVTRLLDSPRASKWLGILVREQMEPTAALDIIYEGLVNPIQSCIRSLVARIFGLKPDAQETKLRALAVVGPAVMFHVFLSNVCRTMNWEGYGTAELEAVRRVVNDHVRTILEISRPCLQADSE